MTAIQNLDPIVYGINYHRDHGATSNPGSVQARIDRTNRELVNEDVRRAFRTAQANRRLVAARKSTPVQGPNSDPGSVQARIDRSLSAHSGDSVVESGSDDHRKAERHFWRTELLFDHVS